MGQYDSWEYLTNLAKNNRDGFEEELTKSPYFVKTKKQYTLFVLENYRPFSSFLFEAVKENGYSFKDGSRLRVFLTNRLEEPENVAERLPMAEWLAREANEAGRVKREAPVMVVLGSPPYNVSSVNKSAWIQNLIAVYKSNLNEKKLNLDDDYIKFIRYGQYFIDKNASGVAVYITANLAGHKTCSAYDINFQPAQKWLKDRKGRVLSFENILPHKRPAGQVSGAALNYASAIGAKCFMEYCIKNSPGRLTWCRLGSTLTAWRYADRASTRNELKICGTNGLDTVSMSGSTGLRKGIPVM
jgi:hypothetical protein